MLDALQHAFRGGADQRQPVNRSLICQLPHGGETYEELVARICNELRCASRKILRLIEGPKQGVRVDENLHTEGKSGDSFIWAASS